MSYVQKVRTYKISISLTIEVVPDVFFFWRVKEQHRHISLDIFTRPSLGTAVHLLLPR